MPNPDVKRLRKMVRGSASSDDDDGSMFWFLLFVALVLVAVYG